MGYQHRFRLSSHAVISNHQGQVLLLKATYGECAWGLPGGGLEPGETVHQALLRECREELGVSLTIRYLSGVYYHAQHESQTFIFRCDAIDVSDIQLSKEHSDWRWFDPLALREHHQVRIKDCLEFDGSVRSRAF